jgi:hypothetical protein
MQLNSVTLIALARRCSLIRRRCERRARDAGLLSGAAAILGVGAGVAVVPDGRESRGLDLHAR